MPTFSRQSSQDSPQMANYAFQQRYQTSWELADQMGFTLTSRNSRSTSTQTEISRAMKYSSSSASVGPTFAFKDVALQFSDNPFEFFLLRRNSRKKAGEARERLTVVDATSGDTCSRCCDPWIAQRSGYIYIYSPSKGACITYSRGTDDNGDAVKGTFDDCQDIVKALFADGAINRTRRLGAINSINWARILAQTVYYFLAYFHVRRQLPPGVDATLQFVVPTGNFGDILAGYYAKRMGLPCARLAVATNENDIPARFWRSGVYEKRNFLVK